MNTLLFSLDSIAVLIPAFYLANQCFPKQYLEVLGFAFTIVLSLMTTIELILGSCSILNNFTLLGTTWVVCIGLILYFRKYPLSPDSVPIDSDSSPAEFLSRNLNKRGLLFLALIATVVSIPVQVFWIKYLFLLHEVHPLASWDVVTYHLPNAIDYLQGHSLWTMKGSFSQYPGGNELINMWSFISLKTDSLLGLTSAAFNLAIVLILLILLRSLNLFQSRFYHWLNFIFIVCILWLQPDYQLSLFAFGQNDLPLACVEILALWLLLKALDSPDQRRYWIAFGAMLGIGIGIKPNGLYYFLGFLILMGSILFFQKKITPQKIFKISVLVVGISSILGGFWYLRNFIIFGTVFEASILESGFPGAIVNNLFNPDLYVLDNTNLTLMGIIIINLIGWLVS
jgi:hypothetical protein